jgi:hypothetical protein
LAMPNLSEECSASSVLVQETVIVMDCSKAVYRKP